MARAKHTDRAAARRRHRAAQVDTAVIDGVATDASDAPPPVAGRAAPVEQRRGMRYAFGAAFRPLDLRGDLAALPSLLRKRSVLLTIGVQILAVILAASGSAGEGSSLSFPTILLFQYFVYPPPMGAAFLVGATVPRASWLVGVVVGLISAVAYVLLLQTQTTLTEQITPDVRNAALFYAVTTGPAGGALFAAVAAWYLRFLRLANPNAYQRRQASRGKPARGSARRR